MAAGLLAGTTLADRYAVRIARLAYLAPDITAAILDGRQPPAMTSRTLLMTPDLPLDWSTQRHLLGFATAPA
jgi:site-specific DNA recombinase